MKKITKVVIPVAGKGTRFLPITKTISKTLLPIIDKPVIQYLIEEAINAKIEEALIIIGPNQKDVIDYFDTNSEYVKNLNGKVYKEIEEITSKPLNEKLVLEYLKDGDNSCAEKDIVIFEKRRILVRAITDYIAGMTDGYALEEYEKLR